MKQMEHPFIAELFEVLEDSLAYYLVMEYVEHGNMLEYVNSHIRLDEDRARRYFCQLISALHYLHHSKFVAHRDLKAENVLLDRNDNIRLIDFGLSNVFTPRAPQLMTACGSPAYAAPEMIQGFPYTKAADMWSVGILLYAMVAGELPFDDDDVQELLRKVISTDVQYPSVMSRSLVDLLRRLLTKNPEMRITIDRLKEHPWVSQSKYSELIGLEPNVFFGNPGTSLDREVVDLMASYGIDCSDLAQAVTMKEYTNETAIYRHMKRYKWTDRMKGLLEEMQKLDGPSNLRVKSSVDAISSANRIADRTRPVGRNMVNRTGAVGRRMQSQPPSVNGGLADALEPQRVGRQLAVRPSVSSPLEG
jgi:serine/threonine protein kinase